MNNYDKKGLQMKAMYDSFGSNYKLHFKWYKGMSISKEAGARKISRRWQITPNTSVCIYYSEKPGKSGKVQFKSCRGTVGEKPYSWKLFIATLFVCTSYNRHIMQTLAGPVSPVLKILLWSSKHFHSMTWRNCNVGFKECRKQAKQEKQQKILQCVMSDYRAYMSLGHD